MGGKWNSSQIDVFACRENYTSHHVQKSYVTTNAIIIVVDISSALQCYSLRMRISSKWRVQVSQGESAFIRKRFPYSPPYCILCSVFSIVFFAMYNFHTHRPIVFFAVCSFHTHRPTVFCAVCSFHTHRPIVFCAVYSLFYSLQCEVD